MSQLLGKIRSLGVRKCAELNSELAAVVAQIKAVSPDARFVDATFPNHLLHLVADDCRVLADGRETGPEDVFFATFHDASSMRTVGQLGVTAASDLSAASAPTWVYVGDAISASRAIALLSGGPARILFKGSPEEIPPADPSLSGHRVVVFKTVARRPDGLFGLIPASAVPGDRVLAAARAPAKGSRYSFALGRRGSEDAFPSIVCRPVTVPAQIRIPAAQLINDGPYRSEQEGDYSWLWTGADPFLRIAIGCLPASASAIVVRFSSSPYHRTLAANLRFQLDARPVSHNVEMAESDMPIFEIRVPAPSSRGRVLGVSCRLRTVDNGRILGACIEAIEIRS